MIAFDTAKMEWEPVRPEITSGVWGKTLMVDKVRVVLTKVERGGKFRTHKDKYGHLFYFVSGSGSVLVEGEKVDAKAGLVVRVTAGESHEYENTGEDDLTLISINLPQDEDQGGD